MESSSRSELSVRVRQQEVVAELGQQALEEGDLDRLMADAAEAVAETLGNEYCKVLELLPGGDEVFLRQGVGWQEGLVGTATVPTDRDSQAGYTLISEEPVIVEDLDAETRFSGPDLLVDHDVVSGISVIIGSVDDPWGVLGTHTTEYTEFTDRDAKFVQSVANVLAAAIDRAETEQRLREREARLERQKSYTDSILNAVDDMIYVVDETGTFRRWNDALNEVTGYTDAEIESMRPLEFVAEDDRATLTDRITTVFDSGSARVEADVLTRDGDRIPYEFTASRLEDPDGTPVLAGIGRDVNEQKDRTRELAKYETIVETINDGIYVKDEAGYFTMVNDAYVELTGYDRDELIGEHASLVVDEDAIQSSKEVKRSMGDGEANTPAMEADIQTADGDHVPAEGTFATLSTEDGGRESIGVVRDVTERKRRQRQLEELVDKLEASNERLEQFAYAASHDLQEPLRMVTSYLRLVERRYADELDEDGREFIEFAVDGADRMRDMIEGLLDYSRVDSKGDSFEPVDLDAVLADVRADLEMRIEESDAEISAESLPRVEGDREQLRQVFQNLFDNAIEYSGDDPPRVHVTAERRSGNDGEWEIAVRDEGIGIDADRPDRVFDVFQRLHTVDEHEGAGIGLALCQRIVERHGGELRVDSTPGEGSTFSFTLPATE